MKRILIIIFLTYIYSAFAQSKADTLFVGNNKTILKKVKPFHTIFQDGPVQLASEYSEIDNKAEFNFIAWNDTSYISSYDDQNGSNGQTTFVNVRLGDHTKSNFTFYMSHFVDTISVEAKMLGKLQLFIKSNGHKVFLCAVKIYELRNGVMQTYSNTFSPEGYVFNYFDFPELDSIEIDRRKSTTYILTDLYYIRGKETYFLDRQYVILIK
ncbi:MAG: hypothetical protein V4608_04990 [Bacteroidota bacterium]